MKTQHLFAAVLALLFPWPRPGCGPEAPRPPSPGWIRRMEMQWNDLRSLLEGTLRGPVARVRREEPAPPPPYDWTISEARYEVASSQKQRARAELISTS